jgi:hypothetical protein
MATTCGLAVHRAERRRRPRAGRGHRGGRRGPRTARRWAIRNGGDRASSRRRVRWSDRRDGSGTGCAAPRVAERGRPRHPAPRTAGPRMRGSSSDSHRRPARQWQIRASSPRRGSAARPLTSWSAIAAARPANGGHGRRTSSWPRMNTAHATPILAASAASRWVAHARWFAHCRPWAQSPQRSSWRLTCRSLLQLNRGGMPIPPHVAERSPLDNVRVPARR